MAFTKSEKEKLEQIKDQKNGELIITTLTKVWSVVEYYNADIINKEQFDYFYEELGKIFAKGKEDNKENSSVPKNRSS